MTDKELLELAAKAAGFEIIEYQNWPGMDVRYGIDEGVWNGECIWNPLQDDGDALRLAVALNMSVHQGTHKVVCEFVPQEDGGNIVTHENHGLDSIAATRRAIVRAAAEIGRNMP